MSQTVTQRQSSGRPTVSLAQIVDSVVDGPLPFRFTAYDGSATGPEDAPLGIHVRSPRAVQYLTTAPTSIGLTRAYLMGDLDLVGAHPGDPYPVLRDLWPLTARMRRPDPALLARIVRALGPASFVPPPVPAQETAPDWRRRLDGLVHSRSRDAAAISHHYDVSNRFYELVLGPSMTYTCACYPQADATLEQAQAAKYDLVAQKLGLREGMRLLDVGCGWGGMVRHAVRHYGVTAVGVTLSRAQAAWAQRRIAADGLGDRAEVRFMDYRDVTETGFDAVSSIGLTEHIGVRNYPAYFTFLLERLRPGGRLLNHCITRPENRHAPRVKGGFIDRYIFPDGELTGAGTVVTAMQDCGFEVRHLEDLREHYALTLRDWNHNLVEHWDEAVAEAGEATARLWGVYLAGCRAGFETNVVQLHQVLGVKLDGTDAHMPLRPDWLG